MFERLKQLWKDHGFLILISLSILFLLICYFGGYHTDIGHDMTLPINIETKEKKRPKRQGKKISKGEAKCREVIERLFNRPFPSVRPDFLKNPETSRNLECDMYNGELKLVVERNGAQHYHFTPYFHQTPEDFSKQVYRDQLKKKLLEDQGIRLIIVPYTVAVDDIEGYLRAEISKYPDLREEVSKNEKAQG